MPERARTAETARRLEAVSAIVAAAGSSDELIERLRSVGALQIELGLDSGDTSQHLAARRRIGLVQSQREGTSVCYRVDDEDAFDLLKTGRAIIMRQLAEQQSILQDLEAP